MTEQGAAGIDVIGQALTELDSAEILIVCPGLIHNGDDIGALHCGKGLRAVSYTHLDVYKRQVSPVGHQEQKQGIFPGNSPVKIVSFPCHFFVILL